MTQRIELLAIVFLAMTLPGTQAIAGCPGGNVTLESQAAVDAFPADCFDLAGELRIQDTNPTADPIIDVGPLANLESSGALHLSDLSTLSTASFPALDSVGVVTLYENAALDSVDLPSLSTSGGFYIDCDAHCRVLTHLGLPSLTSTTSGFILKVTAIESLVLPSLTSVGADFEIFLNQDLSSVAVPFLSSVGGRVIVHSNSVLTRLEFPSLISVGDIFYVQSNPSLSDCCSFSDLLGNLDPQDVYLSGNAQDCRSIDEIANACSIVGIPTLGNSALLLLCGLLAVTGLFLVRRQRNPNQESEPQRAGEA